MARLTITLSKSRHTALKEAAARRGKTIGQIIEQSLEFYGTTPTDDAGSMVEKSKNRSGISEREAMDLAIGETRRARQTMSKEQTS